MNRRRLNLLLDAACVAAILLAAIFWDRWPLPVAVFTTVVTLIVVFLGIRARFQRRRKPDADLPPK